MARRFVAATAALALVATPAMAATKPVKARISPHGGHPDTVFRVGFSAPEPAGRDHGVVREYFIGLGFDGDPNGCTSSASRSITKAKEGERVHRRFVPDAAWCRGRWSGTISVDTFIPCDPGDHFCSGMPSDQRTIARFHYAVR